MKKTKEYISLFEAKEKKLKYKGKGQKFILNFRYEDGFGFTLNVFERGRDVGGDHKTMIKIFPELKKYVDLHLSDKNGIPLHALENGYYYLQNPKEFDVNDVAEHFRIPVSEASKLQKGVQSGELDKNDIKLYVDKQKSRWKKEAQSAINWIKKLDDTKEYSTNVKW